MRILYGLSIRICGFCTALLVCTVQTVWHPGIRLVSSGSETADRAMMSLGVKNVIWSMGIHRHKKYTASMDGSFYPGRLSPRHGINSAGVFKFGFIDQAVAIVDCRCVDGLRTRDVHVGHK